MRKRRVVLTGARATSTSGCVPSSRTRWDLVPIDVRATTRDGGRRAGDHRRRSDPPRSRRVPAALPGGRCRDPLRLRAAGRARRHDLAGQQRRQVPGRAHQRGPGLQRLPDALEEGVRRVVACSSNHAAGDYERLVWAGQLDMVTPEMPARSDNWYGWAKAAYELLGFVFATGQVDGKRARGRAVAHRRAARRRHGAASRPVGSGTRCTGRSGPPVRRGRRVGKPRRRSCCHVVSHVGRPALRVWVHRRPSAVAVAFRPNLPVPVVDWTVR